MNETIHTNYGPLKQLVGVWKGDKGLDTAPDPDAPEENPYYEVITITEGGDISNAEEQIISLLHYRRLVYRKSDQAIFHDQTGYWMWDNKANILMYSLNIPRAVSLISGTTLAESNYTNGKLSVELNAGIDNENWGIVQSPFMKSKALTKSYKQVLTVENGKMTYTETTMLDIYGKEFKHTDTNELILQK